MAGPGNNNSRSPSSFAIAPVGSGILAGLLLVGFVEQRWPDAVLWERVVAGIAPFEVVVIANVAALFTLIRKAWAWRMERKEQADAAQTLDNSQPAADAAQREESVADTGRGDAGGVPSVMRAADVTTR